MTKNDPAASVETLPHTTGPDKVEIAVARMGLDRLRLWLRGDMSVGLDDRDIIALETVSGWLRAGTVLSPGSVLVIENAIRHVGAVLQDGGGCVGRDLIAQLERAREVLHGE